MNEAKRKLQAITEAFAELHEDLINVLREVSKEARGQRYSAGDLADFGYLCYSLEKLFDEYRKDSKSHKELMVKLMTVVLLRDPDVINNDDNDRKAKRELCTAIPDLTTFASIPRPGTDEFRAIMRHYGFEGEAVEKGLVKFDFGKMKAEITRLKEDGKPLPDGLGKTYDEYTARFYKKRG